MEFFIERATQHNEEVFLCGSISELGDWDLRRAFLCHRVDISDNYWSCRLTFANVKLGDTIGTISQYVFNLNRICRLKDTFKIYPRFLLYYIASHLLLIHFKCGSARS